MNQQADAFMGIFGFKRVENEMEKTNKEILIERLALAREKAKSMPKVVRTKLPSLRKAINDQCKACGYDPLCGGGTWKQQITACAVTRCGLWPVRPISKSRKTLESAP